MGAARPIRPPSGCEPKVLQVHCEMNYRESRFSSTDGLQLHQRCWLPEGKATGVVVLIHGLAEHAGRYASVAERLAGERYAVYALDLRGHGLSLGRRIYMNSFEEHLADVGQVIRQAQAEQPGLPLFLFGHSMGGLIAASLAADHITGICGVAVSAAAIQLHGDVFPMLRWLALPASLLLPTIRVVQLNFNMVSRDPKAIASMENDPLVYQGHIPNRTAGEMLRAGFEIRQTAAGIEHPLLILHGTADAITDVEGARQLYQRAGSFDKTLKLYDGLYHNLLDEPEKDQVMADLVDWFNRRRDRSAASG